MHDKWCSFMSSVFLMISGWNRCIKRVEVVAGLERQMTPFTILSVYSAVAAQREGRERETERGGRRKEEGGGRRKIENRKGQMTTHC